MTIGIDIDDTITDTNELISEIMNKNNLGDVKFDFDAYDSDLIIKYKSIISNNIVNVLTNCKLKDNVKEVIDYLRDKGHKILLITSRSNYYSDKVYDATIEYLKRNNIYYDDLLFGYSNKVDICLEKNVDIMLDDKYELIKNLENTCVCGVLFLGNHNKIFNHTGYKVSSWNEFKLFVDNYKK